MIEQNDKKCDCWKEISRLEGEKEELMKVVRLCKEVFDRNLHSDNFLGDDDHELNNRCVEVLSKFSTKGDEK